MGEEFGWWGVGGGEEREEGVVGWVCGGHEVVACWGGSMQMEGCGSSPATVVRSDREKDDVFC